jgi:hypothetical protein
MENAVDLPMRLFSAPGVYPEALERLGFNSSI